MQEQGEEEESGGQDVAPSNDAAYRLGVDRMAGEDCRGQHVQSPHRGAIPTMLSQQRPSEGREQVHDKAVKKNIR